jgi:hypothetical protein
MSDENKKQGHSEMYAIVIAAIISSAAMLFTN